MHGLLSSAHALRMIAVGHRAAKIVFTFLPAIPGATLSEQQANGGEAGRELNVVVLGEKFNFRLGECLADRSLRRVKISGRDLVEQPNGPLGLVRRIPVAQEAHVIVRLAPATVSPCFLQGGCGRAFIRLISVHL